MREQCDRSPQKGFIFFPHCCGPTATASPQHFPFLHHSSGISTAAHRTQNQPAGVWKFNRVRNSTPVGRSVGRILVSIVSSRFCWCCCSRWYRRSFQQHSFSRQRTNTFTRTHLARADAVRVVLSPDGRDTAQPTTHTGAKISTPVSSHGSAKRAESK